MDETAICLFQSGGKGNIFLARADPAVQHAPLAMRRSYLTHVAFVCDDPRLQPLLPQVLIGNERTIPARQLAALRRGLPPNVYLLRERSAWNNAALCAKIIRWLGAALAPHAGTHQPILLLDCARIHVGAGVFAACSAVGVWAVLVPPRMTWLLQVLDTHAFFLYKLHLQKAVQATRLRTASGSLGIVGLVPCVCAAIRCVLQGRPWATAFDYNGFGSRQVGLGDRVRTHLQLAGAPDVADTRPSAEVVKRCFPKRSRVPAKAIWRPFDAPLVVGTPLAAAAPPAPALEHASALGSRRSARLLARMSAAPLCGPPPPVSGASSSSSSVPPLAPPPAKVFAVRLGPRRG